jgi:hypothetical protein
MPGQRGNRSREEVDEKIQENLALIIVSLLDVVKLQHETNDDMAEDIREIISRVEALERRISRD